jgi:hypothetical protein
MSDHIVARIHIGELHVDPIVQRALDPNRAQQLADKFDPNAMGALVVSRRDDNKYFVIDGQHRHAAAILVGYNGKLNCIVHHGLPLEREAELFLRLNDSKLVQAIDKFRVRVLAREPDARAISDVLEKQGWRVACASSPGSFAAVSAAEKVYSGAGVLTDKKPHPELVQAAIFTVTKAWGHASAGANAAIVGGLGQLYARFGDEVDIEKLSHEMSKLRPMDLVAKAKMIKEGQGGTIPAAMARVLVGLHNKARRTNRLPDWRWTR